MKKCIFIGALLICSFFSSFSYAKTGSLYEVKMQVETQSAEERAEAAQKALAQVLTNITGPQHILTDPNIKPHVHAENLLQEFGYSKTLNAKGYTLDLHFDAAAVNQLVHQTAQGPSATEIKLALRVTGIHRQTDFTKLIFYLQHLTSVSKVDVSQIAGDHVLLNISLRSDQDAFIKAIRLEQKLAPVSDETSQIIYQWGP